VAKSLAGLQQLLLVVTYMASLSPSLEGIVDLSLYIQENARENWAPATPMEQSETTHHAEMLQSASALCAAPSLRTLRGHWRRNVKNYKLGSCSRSLQSDELGFCPDKGYHTGWWENYYVSHTQSGHSISPACAPGMMPRERRWSA